MRTSAPSQGPTALPSASPPAPPIRMPAAERSAPLMKELGLSREQGIRLLEQARREPVPLREGLTEEEALALLEVFRRAGAPRPVGGWGGAGAAPAPSPVPGDALTFTSVVFATLHRPGHLVSAESAVHQSVRLTGVSSKRVAPAPATPPGGRPPGCRDQSQGWHSRVSPNTS